MTKSFGPATNRPTTPEISNPFESTGDLRLTAHSLPKGHREGATADLEAEIKVGMACYVKSDVKVFGYQDYPTDFQAGIRLVVEVGERLKGGMFQCSVHADSPVKGWEGQLGGRSLRFYANELEPMPDGKPQ